MSILSFEFVFFFCALLLVYYLLPVRARGVVLMIFSAAFLLLSGWQGAVYLTVLAGVVYLGGLCLDKKKSKGLLALFVSVTLGAMMLCKCLVQFTHLPVLLPLGLSYFTFQAAGYLVDVYQGRAQKEKNPLRIWLYLGYFPQLTQGPVSAYGELAPQLTGHALDPAQFTSGFLMTLWGCFEKLVIADRLAPVSQKAMQSTSVATLIFVLLYWIRLYMDFSGGMDIIRGISRMLGIELCENFRRPFFADSVSDYWRRWHISLGRWFRTYVLYPMTTSRAGIALGKAVSRVLGKKTGRLLPTALATFIIFVLIGLWHGLNGNALIYGCYFGLVMAAGILLDPVSKKIRKRLPKTWWVSALRILRTLAIVFIAQFFSFTASPKDSFLMIRSVFAPGTCALSGMLLDAMPLSEWIIAGVGTFMVFLVDLLKERHHDPGNAIVHSPLPVRFFVLLGLVLLVAVFGMYGSQYDAAAFLYTQF